MCVTEHFSLLDSALKKCFFGCPETQCRPVWPGIKDLCSHSLLGQEFGTKLPLLALFIQTVLGLFVLCVESPVQAATARPVFQAQWHFVMVVEIQETWVFL